MSAKRFSYQVHLMVERVCVRAVLKYTYIILQRGYNTIQYNILIWAVVAM